MTVEDPKADLSSLRIRRDDPGRTAPGAKRTLWIVIAVVILLVMAGFFFFVPQLPGNAVEVDLTSVALTYPSQANAVLTASGYVVAQQKAAVASKGTGRLEYLGVEEGDKVKKGQVIARLEDQDMIAALQKAHADLQVARADSLDAQRTLARLESLFQRGLTSTAELDAGKARASRVEATINSARAAVRGAEVAVENTRIRAPFDGTVLTKNADVGEVVAPFASSASSRGAVVSMADMSSLQVEADVSESNITKVMPGQRCEIVLDAYPERRYAGRVHKIVPTADRAKATVLTKVAFDERDERVLPEMSAKVTFLSREADTAAVDNRPRLTIPASSVITKDGVSVVLLVRDGRIVETPVRLGPTLATRVEIIEGAAQGDQIVLHPQPGMASGTRVKPRSS